MLRIFAVLLMFATSANAGPDRISILLKSHHGNAGQAFEEFNPGVFLEWESNTYNRLSYSVGAYRNSYGRGTVATGLNINLVRKNQFRADVFAGAAHYPRDGESFGTSVGDVVPMLGLRLRYRSLYLLALPSDGKVADYVLGYGLTFPLQ